MPLPKEHPSSRMSHVKHAKKPYPPNTRPHQRYVSMPAPTAHNASRSIFLLFDAVDVIKKQFSHHNLVSSIPVSSSLPGPSVPTCPPNPFLECCKQSSKARQTPRTYHSNTLASYHSR